ncbi:MAG TPA: Crp/Fnr family transcriptional regulator, partial [Marinobacter sp.]|nr:Crp/Fnr family transcriptional regulator [Marinobacter sp.]
SSSPCLLPEQHLGTARLPDASSETILLNSLSRVFGICLNSNKTAPENLLLSDLARLFSVHKIDAETVLEKHDRPWTHVYLIQYGVVRMFRETASGKVAIHHFFSEGDIVWPVFGRSRTIRNTLCLNSSVPVTAWVADFAAFRSEVQNHGEGQWPKFALALTEELAELASMREFRKLTMSASERYALMQEEYPELTKRVPDNQLAAWLGVVPATFSRLKSAASGRHKTR